MLVAIILARSGSKGLKDKNMLFLGNKPLSCYTIDAALNSSIFNKIIFSTDSIDYINDLKSIYSNKIEYDIRPKKLATDESSSFDSIEYLLKKIKGKVDFCLLQPTSPLRNEKHINEAFKLFNKKNFVVSFTESDKPSSLYMDIENGKLASEVHVANFRRQDHSKKYFPNGAIYFANKDLYLKYKTFFIKGLTNIYIMNKIDAIDIDTIDDFNLALSIIRNKREFNFKDTIKNKFQNIEFNKQKNIAIGDSLIENWELPKNFINLGVSGINSKEYLNLIPKKKKIPCNKLVVLLGTNDFQNKIKCDLTIKNIESLIKIFDFKELKILSIPFTLYRNDRSNFNYNNNLMNINELLDKKFKKSFFDINKIISKNNKLLIQYTTDGLHFNEKCYKLLSKEIL